MSSAARLQPCTKPGLPELSVTLGHHSHQDKVVVAHSTTCSTPKNPMQERPQAALTCCPVLQVSTHLLGAGVGVLSTFTAALYQIWTGRKQADLSVNGNQLLQQVAPASAGLLTLMVPLMEPMGLWGGFVRAAGAQGSPAPAQGLHLMQSTLLGYDYTPAAVGTILLSCVMGLSVTLSSYWAIGMTSPLTFNVLGHVKTVLVLAAGILVFGDTMTAVKGAGLLLSMCGVVWYSIK